jgi:peptidoglycan/xylan/chitin deacetylase (PgdA/CDA1 family)
MQKISILMYHQVGVFKNPRAHRATFCHVKRFRAQMFYLHHFGYRVVPLEKAVQGLFGGERLGRHSVVLTFDDGYQNVYDFALPVLQRYGFPATVFLVSGLVGGTARWLADDGRESPDLLNASGILDLRKKNITFGSHTMSHPRLTRLDPVGRDEELRRSKVELEALLGQKIHYFCYPYGDFNDGVAAAVKEAGYQAALTCIRGSATSSDDPFILPRKAISFGDSLAGFFWKLHMKHKKKHASL